MELRCPFFLVNMVHKDIYVTLCNYVTISPDKVIFFNREVLVVFLFLGENICCGYSLEVPH